LSCHFNNSALIPAYTQALGHFPLLYSGVLISTKKDRVVFGSTPEFRGHLRRIGMLDCFLTREQVLQDWNTEKKSLHLRHLGIFTEKRIFLGFVAVFLLSRFVRRFLD
jgi:hypothetical protein